MSEECTFSTPKLFIIDKVIPSIDIFGPQIHFRGPSGTIGTWTRSQIQIDCYIVNY